MKRNISHGVFLMTLLFMVLFGSYVSPPVLAADNSDVEKFVTRFYELCLGRSPESAGLDGWVAALLNGTQTGSDVANGFVFSPEFLNKNTTNEKYLQVLYEAFFNRQPDSAGRQGWLDAFAGGSSRQDILNGFIYATEFAELCEGYGIKAFEGHTTKAQREAVEAFVTRFYQLCLDRDPEAAGLEGWTNNLLNQIQTGADVANGFIFSQEFINKNTTHDKYLTILYKAFFNRSADQAGWDGWLSELNSGKNRGEVLDGFIYSTEFANLCCEYGINAFAGSATCDEGDGGKVTLDRSDVGFVDNLLARVKAGEWTRGEGLVATLKLFVGELDTTSVLRHSELLTYEGTGILAMAYEYLEDGPDTEAKAEISRLLDLLVFSNEQLEAMAGIPGSASKQNNLSAVNGPVEDCQDFFTGYEIPPGVSVCLEYDSSDELEESYPGNTYRVFYPAAPLPNAGWEDRHYDLALDAMEETIPVYDLLFTERMREVGRRAPSVSIVFSVMSGGMGAAPEIGRPCGISIHTDVLKAQDTDFKQMVAHELAHCFQKEMFEGQTRVKYEFIKWWVEGLANYLSNVVYSKNDLEWGPPPANRAWLDYLAYFELKKTLLDFSYENGLFFQYIQNRKGDKGFIDIIKSLPTSGGRLEQQRALASYPDMKEFYHDFAKAMTDKTILDTSEKLVPYNITEVNCPTITLTEPLLIQHDFDEPFSVSRNCLEIEEDNRAILDFDPKGQVRESARPADDFEWKKIPSELPVKDCNPEIITVVTTVERNSGFELNVPKVEEVEGLCDILGEWVVDNDSLDVKATAFELNYVSGQIRANFRDDGTVDVVYDNWEYQVFDYDRDLDVGGIIMENYEELTHTTNAQGTTTYEIEGNRINFGHSFESDFLKGTEKVHFISVWTPSGYIPDTDEVYDREASGRHVFVGSPDYELGSQLRLTFWNREYILTRVGSADE